MSTQLIIKENTGDGWVAVFKATFADSTGKEMREIINRLGDATLEATVKHEATVQIDQYSESYTYDAYGKITHTG